jgi:hypothetical protein
MWGTVFKNYNFVDDLFFCYKRIYCYINILYSVASGVKPAPVLYWGLVLLSYNWNVVLQYNAFRNGISIEFRVLNDAEIKV